MIPPIGRVFLSTAVVCALAGAPAAAQPRSSPDRIDRALRDALNSGARTQHVIISVKPGHRADIRRALEAHGDVIKAEHPFVDALSAEVHSEDIHELGQHPWIQSVSIDAQVHAGRSSSRDDDSATTADVLRETLGLPAAAERHGPDGGSVGVAVIDSGIAPTVDLADRIIAFYDFTRGGIPSAPFDDYGHGTHVAGLIGGGGARVSKQFQGIAPAVHFVGMKVLDKTGAGNTSDVIKALEYVTANHALLKVQIVNLSLGHPIFEPAKTDPLVQAVERATQAGLIVVASAGNYGENDKTGKVGYTGITSPGNAPSAITVGAAETRDTERRRDDTVAPYSSRGPTWYDAFAKPDVVAPGHHLVSDATSSSTLFKQLPTSRKYAGSQPFLELSGSSMAAAVTSGVAALIVDAHNRANYSHAAPLTANVVKAILEYSAIPIDRVDPLTQGTGEINAAGGIALASAIDTSAAGNAWWLRTGVPSFTMIGGRREGWSENIIWGDTILTGDLLFEKVAAWQPSTIWGSNIVWGTSVAEPRASNIVWGTNVVWGTNIVWSDRMIGERLKDMNIVWGTSRGDDNVVWGTSLGDDNIVWGTLDARNIVWGTTEGSNIVWGTAYGDDNIVWGTTQLDNVVWGSLDDNVIWGTTSGDNVVWGSLVGSLPPPTATPTKTTSGGR